MANYYGTGRSNYFKVKDHGLFVEFCSKYNLEQIYRDGGTGFICTHEDGHPTTDNESSLLLNWEQELASLLEEGEVAIFMSVGNESKRYVCGVAIAINSSGKVRRIDLDNIYKKAAKLTPNPDKLTGCSY